MGNDDYTMAMELLKTSFDVYCTDLEQALKQSNPDVAQIQGSFRLLRRLNDEFEEESNKLIHSMLSANKSKDAIAKVMKDSHEAMIRFSSLAFNVERLMTTNLEKTISVSSNRPKLNLPKIDFRKFGGEIKDWLQFWSLFKRIHDDDEMENDDKFQYLLQSTIPNSKARQLIDSYPPTGDNYSKAIESLKSRFGRDDLLIEYYVRELLKLVFNNLTNKTNNLTSLFDKMESQLRALDTLGVTTDNCAAMLYPLLESCLPEEILRTWQRNSEFSIIDPLKTRLKKLMEFLKREVENEERIALATNFEMKNRKKEPESKPSVPTATGFFNQNPRCSFCREQHQSNSCQEALKLSLEQRKQKLLQNGSCYRCLRQGHLARKCNMFSKLKCAKCGGKHVPLMCPTEDSDKASSSKNSSSKDASSKTESLADTQVTTGMSNQTCKRVFLQTLAVNIVNNDQSRRARVLLDTGSERSYILRKIATCMQMQAVRTEEMMHSLFGGYSTEAVNHNCYMTQLDSLDGQYSCSLEVYDQVVICGNITSIHDGCWHQEMESLGISLSDTEDGPIELLLGADVIGRLYTGARHVLPCGLVLVETKLGWTLMGKAPTDKSVPKTSCMLVTSMLVTDKMVTDFWNLELLGINDPVKELTRAETEKATMEHFKSTVRRNEDSRYEVSLPWKENHPVLPTNFHIAKKRLDSLMKKLDKDGYREDYDKLLQEWLEEGIIEEVSREDHQFQGHYLPHRHVVKLNTTKLRPVFDASARESSLSPSLNQCLEKGMNFIELIPSILIRFRQFKYGVISDIRKAFLQISLNHRDRNFLKFLWYTPENELKIFRHTRVVFGLTCSPFLLGAVIQHHLRSVLSENSKFPQEFLTLLGGSFYVDNSIISFDYYEEIEKFKEESQNAMMEAKMDLRCWEFTEQRDAMDVTNLTSVLGLKWNKFTDTLGVSLVNLQNILIGEDLTKKMILSTVSRIFDVIGFVSPALLIPKVLLQTTCKLKLSWNSRVPEDIKQKFFDWFNEIHYLEDVRIPRWIRPEVKRQCKLESLHLFCDASQNAYSAVIFLRVESSRTIELKLIQSKNRVAPIKDISIPRLELLAATIGSRILASVRGEFDINIPVYCWSDSSTVLSWIKRIENWKPFVRNRVQEILQLTTRGSWHHVPGAMNPADLPSRGCLPKKLLECSWWNGPEWLLDPPEKWPNQVYDVNEQVVLEEKMKGVTSMANHDENRFSWLRDTFKKFGNYNTILRLVTWMMRFIRNFMIKKTKRFGPIYLKKELSVEEIERAEKVIIWKIQQEYFGENDNSLKNFKIREDEYGILRLETKISEREDTNSFKYPAILPGKHPVVKYLIEGRHVKLMHAGVQTVLANLREEFWIIGGKKSVRAVILRCVVCQRHHTKHLEAVQVPLPRNRVRNASVFEIIGVDATGPLISRDKGKVWILIFTCAIYRAIHLEVITSMSTDCFLLAFRRFIARRGRPSIVYSDNGTNFIGAENALAELDWEDISKLATVERIQWIFNPPTAPWWGGWWESLIKLLKRLLRKVLGRTSLTSEELQTIVCDCEAVVNQRPLTSLSESPDDWTTLTPAAFLQDITENGVLDLDRIEATYLRRRYRYRLKMRDELRRRFRNEYLGTLIMKNQKKSIRESVPRVGDLGFIGVENSKRFEWPLARIQEVIPGKDGVIRLLRLKVPSGNQILRPIQRFYPLEVSGNEDIENLKEQIAEQTTHKEPVHIPASPETNTRDMDEENDELKRVTRSGRVVKAPKRLGF